MVIPYIKSASKLYIEVIKIYGIKKEVMYVLPELKRGNGTN